MSFKIQQTRGKTFLELLQTLTTLWLVSLTRRSICKEDPGNLNAWANLGYVYDKLGRELDTAECVEKVSHLMGLDGGEASQEETRLLAARCLAEQAYVYPYDVQLDSEDDLRDRLTAALSLYNRALDYGGQLVRQKRTDMSQNVTCNNDFFV